MTGKVWCKMFQFHYGSIKMEKTQQQAVGYTVFQFHYGSIKIE